MFLVDDIDDYDPYASVVEIGGIQSNDLYQYIKRYNKTFENESRTFRRIVFRRLYKRNGVYVTVKRFLFLERVYPESFVFGNRERIL